MKNFMRTLAAMAVIGLVAVGCAQDQPTGNEPRGGDGTLVIKVTPSNPGGTRALIGESDANVIDDFENSSRSVCPFFASKKDENRNIKYC